jgi:hypothetical protein
MMFTNLSAKLAGMKVKVLAGTAVAGAALMMAVPAAQAQHVRFGVTIGAPVYVAPAPPVMFAGPGYYDGVYFGDYDSWRGHYLVRDRDFDRRDFDGGYHRDFDRDRHFDRDYHRDFDRDRHFDRDHDRR